LPWTGFWLIGPLGVMGLLLCRRPTPNQVLMLLVAIAAILSILPFKGSERYRLPPAVLLTLFAALSLWYMYRWFKSGNRRALYRWMPVFAVLCLICWPDWPELAASKSARHDFFIGKHYEESGRLDKALQAYRKSMQDFPWDPDSPYRIGRLLAGRHQLGPALEYLKIALAREPEFPEVYNELARLDIQAGRLESAEAYLKTSLRLAPTGSDALLLMAVVQRLLGNSSGEIAFLKEAVGKTRRYLPLMLLAKSFTRLQHYEEAVDAYDFVMRSRQVEKPVRVVAAMLAGITRARFFNDAAGAAIYWQYVVDHFERFSFFSLQAKFLNGTLTEETFRRKMGDSAQWRASAQYAIGLAHWLQGDISAAVQAFEQCLQADTEIKSPASYSPQKWAREDLLRIQTAGKLQKTP
jgi:tetratricopeptide (TPR) repeat protein